MFCGFKKHHEVRKFITMQYQSVIDKLKKQCTVKNDTEFEMKVGPSFDDFPAHDAKHHLQCLTLISETANLTKPVQCISIVLNC